MEKLKQEIKELIVENLMLDREPAEIGDEEALFGEGLALDSVDALQLAVALEKKYGLKLADNNAAKETLASVASIASAVEKSGPSPT